MDKTISTASFDVITIRQPNGSYKSTAFQVAFSSNLLKNLTKKNQVQLYVNDEKVDIPLHIDIKNGRISFIKHYEKRNILSDSSDVSDDDISQPSKSRDKIVQKNKNLSEKKQKVQYKNEKAPKPFWQFAWLFKGKAQQSSMVQKSQCSVGQQATTRDQSQSSNLQQIPQQQYQGEQSSKQPMFHLSLCKSSIKNNYNKQIILNQFFKKRVPYQQFIKDPPKYLTDSELIVKIDNSLYTWELGIAILTCRLAYGKELKPQLIDDMIRNKFTKSKFISYFTGENLTKIDISDTVNKKQFTINSSMTNFPAKMVARKIKAPDTETLRKMNLKEGLNRARFVLNIGNSKQQVCLKIFLWNYNQKLIVSDIDGTITKSDIAGQLLTNYIHVGVTKLFAEAYKRGYKIVYLTARAIGQYNQTIKFLQSAQQNGVKLPEGPLLMSPDGFIRSFTRQIIDKTPDFLKAKILANLREIFPQSGKPLYCGFGNRQTDSVAYLKTDMDPEKIFFITPKSIISKQSRLDFTTNYVEMLQKLEEYFPNFVKQIKIQEQSLINNEQTLQQEYFTAQKRKISLSECSQSSITKQNVLLKSQKVNRSKIDDVEERQMQFYTSSKHARCKSVQNNIQCMDDKIQQLENMLIQSQPISQFNGQKQNHLVLKQSNSLTQNVHHSAQKNQINETNRPLQQQNLVDKLSIDEQKRSQGQNSSQSNGSKSKTKID